METRWYQTQDIDLQRITQALVYEYQAQGYETQQAGTPEQILIQIRKESTLRALTGFNISTGYYLAKGSRRNARQSGRTGLDRSDRSRSSGPGFAPAFDHSCCRGSNRI